MLKHCLHVFNEHCNKTGMAFGIFRGHNLIRFHKKDVKLHVVVIPNAFTTEGGLKHNWFHTDVIMVIIPRVFLLCVSSLLMNRDPAYGASWHVRTAMIQISLRISAF